MLQIVILRLCSIIDIERLLGDERGDVFVPFIAFGLLRGFRGLLHSGDVAIVSDVREDVCQI